MFGNFLLIKFFIYKEIQLGKVMTNSIQDVHISEGARQILDTWEANMAVQKYHLFRTTPQTPEKDVLIKSNKMPDDKNDGKISLKEKPENFCKGLAVPVNTILASPSNFMLTLGSVAACGALIALTGGAIAPVLVGAGLIGSGISIGNGIYKQSHAKNDDEAKQAWQDIGAGTFTFGLSALGAKTAVKEAGITTSSDAGVLSSSLRCITKFPGKIVDSFSAIAAKFKNAKASNTQNTSTTSTSNGFFTGIKNGIKKFWNGLKAKVYPSAGTNTEVAVQQYPKQNKNDIIRVSDDDIEIIDPDVHKSTPKKQTGDGDIIDAEFTEVDSPKNKITSSQPKLIEPPKDAGNNNQSP